MSDCPLCTHPLVWSDDQGRTWCSVWGTHAHQLLPPEPTPLMIAAAGLSMNPHAISQRHYENRRRRRQRAAA